MRWHDGRGARSPTGAAGGQADSTVTACGTHQRLPRHRLRRVAVGVATLVLAAAAVAGTGILHWPLGGDVVTLLLLGSDRGPPRAEGPLSDRADADGFHVVFVAGDSSHATMVNVPRDAWVSLPGHGRSRIAGCLNYGPETCVATVEALWDLEVDDWLLTSMWGLGSAFEEFGGVEIEVDRPLTSGGPDLAPGVQRLGFGALTYARDRKSRPGGDFDRTAAQAELLRAAHRTLAAEGVSVREVADALAILRRHTITSAGSSELLRYAFAAAELAPEDIADVTLPGQVGWAGPANVVFLDPQAAGIVADAADDARVGR